MNYGYANGTIKAIEEKIIDEQTFLKLSKVEQSALFKTLQDMGYGETYCSDIEELIKAEMKKTRELLFSVAPDSRLVELFFLGSDIQNIKVIWKMRNFQVDYEHLLVDSHAYPKEVLKKIILDQDYTSLGKKQKQLFQTIEQEAVEIENPRILSTRIEQNVLEYVFKFIKAHPNQALKVYFQSFIDFANLLSMTRCHHLNWSKEVFEEMLLSGGLIDKNTFLTAYGLEQEERNQALKPYYFEKLIPILNRYYEKKDANHLEFDLDVLQMEIVSAFRHDSLTIGPMMYYYMEKLAEAKNIRTLLAYDQADRTKLLKY